MNLKMAFHSTTSRRIVEVYDNAGAFVACIYPDEATNSIKIVSKHFLKCEFTDGTRSNPPVDDYTIAFNRK